jgi:hypothetical protein
MDATSEKLNMSNTGIQASPVAASDAGRIFAVCRRWNGEITLGFLLAGFFFLETLMPLRTAVEIGADEGFELAKATLCVHGYKLYSQVWDDQPPLHTFLVTEALKHISPSVLVPRLITICFAAVLLASIFQIVRRVNGLAVAGLTTGVLIASPGFLTLSSSCMLEIPALAATAALWMLLIPNRSGWRRPEIAAGILFGVAFEIKLIGLTLLPLAALIIWLENRQAPKAGRRVILSGVILAAVIVVTTIITDLLSSGGDYLAHFQQSWTSHFAKTQSSEYGSPSDYPFGWVILLRNWDATIPALVGLVVCAFEIRQRPLAVLPMAWLALNLTVFGLHKPWWNYYYVHTAIPLCWCAAIGLEAMIRKCVARRGAPQWALFVIFAGGVVSWMGGRVYLQIKTTRASPRTASSLVFTQINRFKPYTKFFYACDPIYSFHAGIPMPPDLAVVMLKRLWSGDMTNAKIADEMSEIQPEMVLLRNDSRPVPFHALIRAQYQLVYEDQRHRLYVHKSIAKFPKR